MGFCGIAINWRYLIRTLLAIELMLLGIGLLFILLSVLMGTITGQCYAFLILAVAAAEAAIGLGLIVCLYSINHAADFTKLKNLRG